MCQVSVCLHFRNDRAAAPPRPPPPAQTTPPGREGPSQFAERAPSRRVFGRYLQTDWPLESLIVGPPAQTR